MSAAADRLSNPAPQARYRRGNKPERRFAGAAACDEIGPRAVRRAAFDPPELLGHCNPPALQVERCDGTFHQSGKRIVSRTGRELVSTEIIRARSSTAVSAVRLISAKPSARVGPASLGFDGSEIICGVRFLYSIKK